jgi:hypothetical protein
VQEVRGIDNQGEMGERCTVKYGREESSGEREANRIMEWLK